MIQIGGVYTTFCQKEGIHLQKYRDGNGRCIAILFESIRVRGRLDSPEIGAAQKLPKSVEDYFDIFGHGRSADIMSGIPRILAGIFLEDFSSHFSHPK